ncbi:PREDICTED: secoisolariciresinol dehydrogenase-like [Nelumbo nucifera]|uniref:Secoisolariciresinol dehydrogenase-like n=1 Tax=Nelumbo nucifera TaxID=4432 RepID=A0A1U7ZKP2_NELNU|nr:PREDICTED: secoisolariciresinol dehydrogenase-like [Nelumbo nucifera]
MLCFPCSLASDVWAQPAIIKQCCVGLTKNAAVELGKYGIGVNCLSPFGIATPLFKSSFKLNGDQETEEIICAAANLKGVTLKVEVVAQAELYLGSDDSRYVSGHNLFIDGDFSIVNPSFNIFNYLAES